jgi:hypothetical protein
VAQIEHASKLILVTLFGIYQLNIASITQQTTNMKFLVLMEVCNVNTIVGYREGHHESLKIYKKRDRS